MQCPCCQTALAPIDYEGVQIHTCPGCGGEFTPPESLSHIVRTRDERFPDAMQDAVAHHQPSFGIDDAESHRELGCPGCASTMQLVNYLGDTGVHVDRCAQCGGMWLDQHELEKVQILTEKWATKAPAQLRSIADELESARQRAAKAGSDAFQGSRFAFVNALINRFIDAA